MITNKSFSKDTLLASNFGIIADYNGNRITDNQALFQKTIEYYSSHRKILNVPRRRYLINSYGTTSSAKSQRTFLN